MPAAKPVYCMERGELHFLGSTIPTNRAIVSGGAGLIGSAVMRHLLDKGFEVYNYDLNPREANRTKWINAVRPLHSYMYPDVDAFIDCARYEKQDDQNLTWNTMINHFKRQNTGKIVLFSSIYGHKAPDFSIYDGTEVNETPLEYSMWKGGTEQATRYLAEKLKPYNIQVNCIAPGGVKDRHSEAFQRAYGVHAPMIETRNLLPVIDCLLHPDNAINGAVIPVDNGWGL